MERRNLRWTVLAATLLVLAILACGPTTAGKPSVTITSPPSGTTVAVGEEVQIVSTAAADAGVARVELSINGQVVRSDAPPSGNPTVFPVTQPWTPTVEGDVTASVVAYDTEGAASDPASIRLQVGAAVAEGPTPTPVEDVEGPGGCTLNVSYVDDVTVPDDTEMSPGETFVKTWRVRNSGDCDWGPGFSLVFASGDPMGGPGSAAVPATAAGSTADVSVSLVAPAAPGTYRGNWRVQSDEGLLFGSTLYVQIVVPAPPTDTAEPTNTPPPTETPSPPPPGITPGSTLIPLPLPAFPLFPPAVEQVYTQVTIPAGDIGYGTTTCPNGSLAVSGGYAAHPDVLIYTHSQHGNGWRVYAKNNAGSNKLVTVYAHCLSNTGGSVSQVYSQVTAAAGGIGHPVISCPAGSVVTGGGWASYADGSLHVYNSSRSGNGWQVYARNTTGSDKTVNAYAICLSGTSGTTSQVGNGGSVPAGGTQGVVATCGGDSLAVGGGFAAGTELRVYNTSMKPSTDDRWNVYAKNTAGSAKPLNAYAVCLSFP